MTNIAYGCAKWPFENCHASHGPSNHNCDRGDTEVVKDKFVKAIKFSLREDRTEEPDKLTEYRLESLKVENRDHMVSLYPD